MAFIGDLSQPPAPAPAGDLARLDAEERARVASAAADARAPGDRGGPTPRSGGGSSAGAQRGRPRPLRPRRRRSPPTFAGRAERSKPGHGPERGRGDRRGPTGGRPPGPDEDGARRRRHAARHRPPAPRATWRGAAPGERAHLRPRARADDRRSRYVAGAAAGSSPRRRPPRRARVDAAIVGLLFCGGPAPRRGRGARLGRLSSRRSATTSSASGFRASKATAAGKGGREHAPAGLTEGL